MCTGLNSISPQIPVYPEPGPMTWFGNRVFTEVVKLRGGHTRLGWTLNPMTSVLRRWDTETHTRKGHLKTEGETGGTQPQAKEHPGCRQLQDLGRVKDSFFPKALGGSMALLTAWSQTSILQKCSRVSVCCFKPLRLWDFVMAAPGN